MTTYLSRRETLAGLSAGTVLALGGCATMPRVTASAAPCGVQPLLAAEADRLLALVPEVATYNGADSALRGGPAARRLNDWSPAGEAERRAAFAASHERIAAADCPVGSREALQIATAEAILGVALPSADIPYGTLQPFGFVNHAPYIVSQISGPHIDSPSIMASQQSLRTPQEIDAWLVKLESFGTAFDGVAEKVRADAVVGCIPPKALIAKTLPVLDAFLQGPARRHPLVQALHDHAVEAVIDQGFRDQAIARATRAIEEVARPAYARLREVMAGLMPHGRDDAGVWAQPRGDELYAANVRALGDTDQTPDEIHELGLSEVARITSEMEALLAAQGETGGSVGDRMARLATEARFRFADSDAGRAELLDYLRELVRETESHYDRILPAAMIPRQQLIIRRVPVATQDGAPGGYYDAPSLDGTRPGTYWINLRDMEAVAKFALPTLSYHEGVPGHHTQTAIASGLGEAPLLMRIASFNAYQEGWALYAERFAAELGFYENDPYGDLGRLQDELFRGVRLVVDTGMHSKRWSRERAIDYMREVTGNPVSSCTAEIERYMAWPGQALGYKLGQLRLLALREELKAARGAHYDVREYNGIVLGEGAMPLELVAQRVHAAIRV